MKLRDFHYIIQHIWLRIHIFILYIAAVALHRTALTDAQRISVLSRSVNEALKTDKTHNDHIINAHIQDEQRSINGHQRTSNGLVPYIT